MSLVVHHLHPSRSERIVWLLEELGVPYELVRHERVMGRAPATAKEIHPLGKFPIIEDEGRAIAESGAIVSYLIAKHAPTLAPGADAPEFVDHEQWMHWSEGSAAAWLVMDLIVCSGFVPGVDPGPLPGLVAAEIGSALDWAESQLAGREFACGAALTGADPMLVWVLGLADDRGHLGERPACRAYLERMRARPAYQRALERIGA